MKGLKRALLQATAILAMGFVVAFTHNALSVNGINPLRKIGDVPVITGADAGDEAGIRFVDLDELIAFVDGGAILIDARNSADYEEGHIPGAILFDYYEMGRYMDNVLPLLDPTQRTVVYCYGPDCDDAEYLSRELYMLGFTNLFVFRGGYEEWVGSGGEVESQVIE